MSGKALWTLGARESGTSRLEAIAACRAALQRGERTFARHGGAGAAIPASGLLIALFTIEQLFNGWRYGFESTEPPHEEVHVL